MRGIGSNRRRLVTSSLVVTACWILWGLFNASHLRTVVPAFGWGEALRYGVPDGLLWALLTPVPVILARRFPFPTSHPARNAAVHLAAGSAVAILHSLLDTLFNLLLDRVATGEPHVAFADLARKLLVYGFHTNLLLYLVIIGITMYLDRLASLRERERQTAELRSQLTEARLAALRAQLRPHFLFNALHTVGAIIERDRTAGRRVLRQLGELLRASLSRDGDQRIALEREVELCAAYLEIERARFGERLDFTIDVDERASDCAVPTLLLQPLVENSIRHGVERAAEPVEVRISAARRDDRVVVRVADSGPGLDGRDGDAASGRPAGVGIGIASVRERLRAHYGDDHRCEISSPPGFTVTVEVPYVRAGSFVIAREDPSAPEERRRA